MNAKEYFEKVVIPMSRELKDRQRDTAFIIATAIVTHHTSDWIARERGENLADVRQRIGKRFPEFGYLGAVANAHKHMVVKSPAKFKGLTNPLRTSKQRMLMSGGKALLLGGRLLITTTNPEYEFDDGVKFDPLLLIGKAVDALSAEFGYIHSAKA